MGLDADLERLGERRGRVGCYQLVEHQFGKKEWALVVAPDMYQTLERHWTVDGGCVDGQYYDVSRSRNGLHLSPVPLDGRPETVAHPSRFLEIGTDDEVKVWCELPVVCFSPWVRLRGITLDERSQTYGPAITFLQGLVDDPEEKWVVTLSKVTVEGRKGFDRDLLMADLFHLRGDFRNEEVAERGVCLNRELVERGLARVLG